MRPKKNEVPVPGCAPAWSRIFAAAVSPFVAAAPLTPNCRYAFCHADV
jgi:hypothetical protein